VKGNAVVMEPFSSEWKVLTR